MTERGNPNPGIDSPSSTDGNLLAAWAAGDRVAGEQLVCRHFALVHRFFRSKVGGDVEDLVQQTFLGCIEGRHRFREECTFKTFLLAIARHQLFNHYRQSSKKQVVDFSLSSTRDLATSPTGVLARHEEERMLAAALQRIPLDLQIVLELVYWEEMDGPEIARVLEVPLNTAYSRLRRAKEALRDVLTELAPESARASGTVDLAAWAERTSQAIDRAVERAVTGVVSPA